MGTVTASAGAVGLAGCTQENSSSGDSTMRIGMAIPLTGTIGPVGISMEDGTEIAKNRFESEHDDFEIELVAQDTQYEPEQGVRAARELIEQENVDVLIGPANSASAQQAGEVAMQNEVIQMNPAASANHLTAEECRENHFRTILNSDMEQIITTRHALDNFGPRMSLLTVNNTYGQAVRDATHEIVEQDGGEIVDDLQVAPDTQDVTAQVETLRNTDADSIMIRVLGNASPAFHRQAHEVGLPDEYPMSTSVLFTEIKALGEYLEGYHAWSFFSWEDDEDENVQQFTEDFQAVSDDHEHPWNHTASAYWAALLPALAAVEQGSMAYDDLVSGLKGIEHDDPVPIKLRECDHQAQIPMQVVELVGSDEYEHPVREPINTVSMEDSLFPCEEYDCTM